MTQTEPTSEEKAILSEQTRKMYADIEKAESEEREKNQKLLDELGISWKDLEELLDGCVLSGPLEVVSSPKGEDQDEEGGVFKSVFVDQRTTGEDSYAGDIYGKLEEGKWLKVSYYC